MIKVGIVGGGITGLTAGFRLKQLGAEVTIFEAGSRVGGPVHTLRDSGYLAEFGPNTVLETSQSITALIHELGIDGRKVYADPSSKNRYIVRDGTLIPLPMSPGAFAGSKLFSMGAKLRLLREPFIGKAAHDETLADFVRRRLGQEFLDYAINPFVAGVYAGDPEKLSTEQAFPKLFALEQEYGSLIKGQMSLARAKKATGEVSKQRARMFSFDEGLQVLIDALEHELSASIRLNTSVQRIASDGNWRVSDTHDNTANFDHVILTAPAYKLASLDISGVDLSPLAEIVYPPVTSLVLGFKRSDVAHPLDGFGMLVPVKEGLNILGTVFSSSLFSGRAPSGHVTLTTYIGGMRKPEHALLDDARLLDLVLSDLGRLLRITGKPTYIHRTTYERAIPQYMMGYEKYKQVMNNVETANPGLHFAGNFRNGISVGDSIKAGADLAELIGH